MAKAQNPQQTKKALALRCFCSWNILTVNHLHLVVVSSLEIIRLQQTSHVVKGASHGSCETGRSKNKVLEGITAVDAEHDLVILKISVPGAQVIPLGDSDTVQVGANLGRGKPPSLEGTFSQGIISSGPERLE